MVQNEEHVLTFASDVPNSAVCCKASQMRRGLRFRGDGVQNTNGANALFLDQWAQSPYNSFDFGQFGHRSKGRSRTGSECERVFCGLGFGSVAERRENRFAFVSIGELIGIVAAAGLT